MVVVVLGKGEDYHQVNSIASVHPRSTNTSFVKWMNNRAAAIRGQRKSPHFVPLPWDYNCPR